MLLKVWGGNFKKTKPGNTLKPPRESQSKMRCGRLESKGLSIQVKPRKCTWWMCFLILEKQTTVGYVVRFSWFPLAKAAVLRIIPRSPAREHSEQNLPLRTGAWRGWESLHLLLPPGGPVISGEGYQTCGVTASLWCRGGNEKNPR